MDIRMPGINGLEILKQLRESEGLSAIPVLVMTSSNDDRIRMGALQLQANDFLTKPANSAELAARVRNSFAGQNPARSTQITFGAVAIRSRNPHQ